MKRFGAMMLAGGLLLGSATGAAALERRDANARLGVNRQHDAEKDAKRAFRQAIQAKQREYRELRRTDDPRAEQVRAEIRAMKDQWERTYGSDDARRGERRLEKGEKAKKQKAGKPHGKRNR
jgi:hypothetical protein